MKTGHAVQAGTDWDRAIVMVGMMGAGKSAIGRRLAQRLGLPFVDADSEIERAAGSTIEEIFAKHGEAVFRDGERRVIARLLEGPVGVLATGGGAFMDPDTRARIRAEVLNAALGNVGKTLEYRPSAVHALNAVGGAWTPSHEGIAELAKALDAGQVETLVILDSNPAYATPGDLGFAGKLAKAKTVIHAGAYVDETAALAGWHLPLSHFLEDWSDGRIDGVYERSCYLEAIAILPDDVRAYTSAADDILRALQASNPERSAAAPPSRLASAGTSVPAGSTRSIPGAIILLAAVAASVLLAGSAGVVLRRVRSRP